MFMTDWRSRFDFSRPYWDDFKAPLLRLGGPQFPRAADLCRLLPDGLMSYDGATIRFVDAQQLSDSDYEQRIYQTGEVSTREDNWHDLFNALVWSRFPRLKVAMNAMHFREQSVQRGSVRGKRRDALTLLDESGALVIGSEMTALNKLARHDWPGVFHTGIFQQPGAQTRGKLSLFLCGHALLEKFLQPYKAMTAQALLLRIQSSEIPRSRDGLRLNLDQLLADALMNGQLFHSPAELSPLPLMGVPGWWPGVQDDDYYSDSAVFRPPRKGSKPAPVIQL
jgi:hypothetical protein